MPDLLRVQVSDLAKVAEGINVYTFCPLAGGTLPPATPGAHIDVHLTNGLIRQYSLAEIDPGASRYVIGVKRDAASRGGSRSMHDDVQVGCELMISAPRNNFPLAPQPSHSIFIAGGIGITPIRSMVKHLDREGASYELHYACRSRREAAFVGEFGAASCHIHLDDEANALLDVASVVRNAPADAHIYFCGPAAMFETFKQAAVLRPSAQVHIELFSAVAEADRSGGFTVVLARSKREFMVPPGETILGILRNAGANVSYSCEEGVCGTCETAILSGMPDHRDAILSEQERASGRTMMICCSGSKSDRLVLDL